ncbi:MAG: hypothetical protein LBP92_14130 [Deltaproteobacteria bacterium]|jgi:ferredoxin|nr:hypothetical protein [Deltaproteobacteria bacterium]
MTTTEMASPPPHGGRHRKSLRDIIEIDEELCDGCGECLPSCAEGALSVKRGRLVLKAEALCDGLGACIGQCPKGALSIVRRFSDDFGPSGAGPSLEEEGPEPDGGGDDPGQDSCRPKDLARHTAPGIAGQGADLDVDGIIRTMEEANDGWPWPDPAEAPSVARAPRERDVEICPQDVALPGAKRALACWPIQMALVQPKSLSHVGASIVFAADCVAFASPEFHSMFLSGQDAMFIGCPKLDDYDLYVAKLGVILRDNQEVSEVRLPIMEVPCCRGLWRLAREALKRSGRRDVRLLGWLFDVGGRPLEGRVDINPESGD